MVATYFKPAPSDAALRATLPPSRAFVLASAVSPNTGRTFNLEAVSHGWAIAGSGLREQAAGFRVAFTDGGARHSRFYASADDARENFFTCTGMMLPLGFERFESAEEVTA